jgi:hypothetical protein
LLSETLSGKLLKLWLREPALLEISFARLPNNLVFQQNQEGIEIIELTRITPVEPTRIVPDFFAEINLTDYIQKQVEKGYKAPPYGR